MITRARHGKDLPTVTADVATTVTSDTAGDVDRDAAPGLTILPRPDTRTTLVPPPGAAPAPLPGGPGPWPGGPGPWPMHNPVRHYDWGSPRILAELQHRDPSGAPEAELWMGAHAADPSGLVLPDGRVVPLNQAMDDDAAAVLGDDAVDRFGPRLPFLLKVLAVGRALSIQVHPTGEQAAVGFLAERAARVPASQRVFIDPYGKPEMLVAASPFFLLAGLRPQQEIARLLGRLGVPRLGLVLADLAERGPASALALLATWPHSDRATLADELRERAERRLRTAVLDDERTALTWVLRLADQHPRDPLAVSACLLRLYRLTPGQAVYLPPGVPHAYLSGTGVEITGASDNVIRGGLTAKHVDGATLTAILDPKAQPLLDVPCTRTAAGHTRWTPPAREFRLSRIEVHGTCTVSRLPDDRPGPQILLCLDGRVRLDVDGDTRVELDGGQSAFLTASRERVTLRGQGTVFRAGVGQEP